MYYAHYYSIENWGWVGAEAGVGVVVCGRHMQVAHNGTIRLIYSDNITTAVVLKLFRATAKRITGC